MPWTEKSQRVPQLHRGPTRVGNSFNSFHNSLFFVIVRPKNVHRSVGACKIRSEPCKPTPFFRTQKSPQILHRSHGVSDRRLGGGAQGPACPPPRGDATGYKCYALLYLPFVAFICIIHDDDDDDYDDDDDDDDDDGP